MLDLSAGFRNDCRNKSQIVCFINNKMKMVVIKFGSLNRCYARERFKSVNTLYLILRYLILSTIKSDQKFSNRNYYGRKYFPPAYNYLSSNLNLPSSNMKISNPQPLICCLPPPIILPPTSFSSLNALL